jgi:hypothetical protein
MIISTSPCHLLLLLFCLMNMSKITVQDTHTHTHTLARARFAYLHIPALGNFCEVFLVLQCFVLLVVCHTEYSQPCFHEIHTFCKHHKSGKQNEDIYSEKHHKSVKPFLEHCVQSGMCHLCAAQYKIIYQFEQQYAVCYSHPVTIPLIYHSQSVTNHFPLAC